MATLLLETDHTVRLTGLKDQAGELVAGATVTADLLNSKFEPINNTPFPLRLIDAGGGDYTARIGDDNALIMGTTYQVRYVARKNDVKRTWFEELTIRRGML